MPQPVVPKRIAVMGKAGIRLRTSGCTTSRRNGVPPPEKGMPMRRPRRALGDLYRLSNERFVKVVKKASVFGHSMV